MEISSFFTDQALALVGGPLLILTGFLRKTKRGRNDYVYIVCGVALTIFGLFRLA